ncbi:MAG TPA: hypothetical protein VKT82_07190 [Ktedonobacterales bacterium]|nr:hypothetical protein [Ktedonobacterales bacterium]
MREQSFNAVGRLQPHLVPRQVQGNLWMLYHIQFEQLLDDFGWFQSRSEAEAKIAELQQVTTPVRFSSAAPDVDAMN